VKGETADEIHRQLVAKWRRVLKAGRSDVHDDIRSGRPSIVTDENIRADRRLTIGELHQQCPEELFSMAKRADGRFLRRWKKLTLSQATKGIAIHDDYVES
jgi:hypothetical protein